MIGCAGSHRAIPIGVDVDRLIEARDLDGLAWSVLADGESLGPDGWGRSAALTAYGTRKEAVLKATGDGLSVDLRGLTRQHPDLAPSQQSWPGGTHVHLGLRPGLGNPASAAVRSPSVRVVERDGTALLTRAAGAGQAS